MLHRQTVPLGKLGGGCAGDAGHIQNTDTGPHLTWPSCGTVSLPSSV